MLATRPVSIVVSLDSRAGVTGLLIWPAHTSPLAVVQEVFSNLILKNTEKYFSRTAVMAIWPCLYFALYRL